MCVIIRVPAGLTFPFSKLKNACMNNPHGFGIVNDNSSLDVYHYFDEKGNDPEFVAKKLEERKDVNQFLHLRYATCGPKNKDNTHPFTVYKDQSSKSQIEFMHNGSFYDFRPDAQNTTDSDTKLFAINLLSPFLYKFNGENGPADIEDPLVKALLTKFFPATTRGVLISNWQTPLYLGTWKTVKDSEDHEFEVSNDDYFTYSQPTRMTEHFKAKEEAEKPATFPKAQQQQQQSRTSLSVINGRKDENVETAKKNAEKENTGGESSSEIVELKTIKATNSSRFLTPQDLAVLFNSDVVLDLDDDTITYLPYLSDLEVQSFVQSKPSLGAKLINWIAVRFTELKEEYECISEKKEKAEKHIENLRAEIRELEKAK